MKLGKRRTHVDSEGLDGMVETLMPSTASAQRPAGCRRSEKTWEATMLGIGAGSRRVHCLWSRNCVGLQNGSSRSDSSRIVRPQPSTQMADGLGFAVGSDRTWRHRRRC